MNSTHFVVKKDFSLGFINETVIFAVLLGVNLAGESVSVRRRLPLN
jgi:hypothetical protein